MNDTTNVEAAVNLDALANDGFLGGALLESDPELVALGWLKPERVSLADLRAAADLVETAGDVDLLAEIHRAIQDQDFGLAGYSDAFRQIVLTGWTPGNPKVESTVGVRLGPVPYSYRRLDFASDDDTFVELPRRGKYDCGNLGRDKAKVVLSVRDGSCRIDLPCEDIEGDCPPCRQYWIDSAAARLIHGLVGKVQLAIVGIDRSTPADAQKLITAIGKQLGPVRRAQVITRSPQYTYDAHIIVTGSMPLPMVLKAIADRPGVSIEYRPVADTDFKALLHSRSKVDAKRCPVRFLHWPKAVKADESAITEYAHNDGYVADAKDVRNVRTMRFERLASLKIPDKVRVRLRESRAVQNVDFWLTGIALDQMALLKLGAGRRAGIRSKNDWKSCIVAGTYDGPKALIRDLAAALDEDGLVSFTARKAMRRAATYIVDEGA